MERFHRTNEQKFETGPGGRLEVESRNGAVVLHGYDGLDVRVTSIVEVDAESRAEAERDFRAVDEGITSSGGNVRIIAPSSERPGFLFFGRGLKVDYEISVPAQTRVEVLSRNGRVDISGIADAVAVENRNGSVRVQTIGGPVRIVSHNGRVDAIDCAADVSLNGRNGHVYATRVAGKLTAETHNGHVVVQDSSGSARLRSANGSLRFTGPVRADLDLEVEGNGPIRLDVPADSRFVLDAEAVRGDIKSDLHVKETASSGEERPTVRLRTVNGSIKIEALEAAR